MLSDDEVLFDHILNKNYKSSDLPSLTIHHTMDMEPTYRQRNGSAYTYGPEYPFDKKQIKQSANFIRKAEGRLLGFIAFHPARQGSLQLCQKARCMGHIGVKFYPPMDYRPNEWDSYPSLKDLFAWCRDEDIPILSHCTPAGFEAWPGTGICSDPLHWAEVLKEYPTLRLCLGHAGGGDYSNVTCVGTGDIIATGPETTSMDGWYSTRTHWNQAGNPCYPRTVVKLCRSYEKVYCDLSYLTAILGDGTKKKRFIANFKAAMADVGKYKFQDKVMYGTDWHMMAMVGHTQEFLDAFKGIFAGEPALTPDMKDKFLFRNAVNFLNLPGFIEHQKTCGDEALGPKAINHLKAILNEAGRKL